MSGNCSSHSSSKKEYANFRTQTSCTYIGTKIGFACKQNVIGACAYKLSVFSPIFLKIASDSLIGAGPICRVIGYVNTSFTVFNFSLVYVGVFLLELGPKMS